MSIDLYVGPCKCCGSRFNPVNRDGLCYDCFHAKKNTGNNYKASPEIRSRKSRGSK